MRSILLVLIALVLAAPPAHADDAGRAEVQRLFLQGRLLELDVVVDDADAWQRYVVLVRDHYWRRRGVGEPVVPADASKLLTQRLTWIQDRGSKPARPYPTAADDPLPILTALIVDREAREQDGRVDAAPLRKLTLDGAEAEALDVSLWALGVHRTFEANPDDVASADRAESLATRNAWIGLGAAFLLLLASVILARRFSPV